MRSNRNAKVDKQARISASIVRSLFLFFNLISVSAENTNLQNHEDTNGRIILIAFKLIAGYNLLIQIPKIQLIQDFFGES